VHQLSDRLQDLYNVKADPLGQREALFSEDLSRCLTVIKYFELIIINCAHAAADAHSSQRCLNCLSYSWTRSRKILPSWESQRSLILIVTSILNKRCVFCHLLKKRCASSALVLIGAPHLRTIAGSAPQMDKHHEFKITLLSEHRRRV
jgi:hypothetical protein